MVGGTEMKGKIDIHGLLTISRIGREQMQYCPIQQNQRDGTPIGCGDWCPAFREPEVFGQPKPMNSPMMLELCAQVGTLFFTEFSDEREGK
jgi:hypothetical protein